MKTLQLSAIAIACVTFLSFTFLETPLTLNEAIAAGKVKATVLPYGEDGGAGIRVDVINTTGTRLTIKMPKGTLFVPDNDGEQTLTTSDDEIFALNPRQERVISRVGFCTELHDGCSDDESTFKLGFTKNDKLLNILNYMDSLQITDEDMIQEAVWCITDAHPVSYACTADTMKTRLVQTRLCALTGQTMPWYDTKADIVMTPDHYYEVRSTQIEGELTFKSDQRVAMQGVVKDSTGKVVFTNPNVLNAPAGMQITFWYRLRVQGWAPGKYYVVYTNNGVEMLNREFVL